MPPTQPSNPNQPANPTPPADPGTPSNPGGPIYAAPVPPPPGYPYTPSGQQPQRSANDTAEYRTNYASYEYVKGLYALDAGYTGKGVTVGIIDDGIDAANPEFAGRISSLSRDFGHIVTTRSDGPPIEADRNSIDNPTSNHGSAVAGLIAANRNGIGMQGIAPDAQLAIFRVDDTMEAGQSFPTSNAVKAVDYAAAQRIKLINRSMVTSGIDTALIRAVEGYATVGGLLINAAGNSGDANPADAINVTDANRQSWLFVGAIDTTGTDIHLARYSNKAGSMKDRYVVAPGDNLTVKAGGNGATTVMSGSSMAAPIVAGIAANILSKWPQLSGIDAGNIILATADDIGDPGVDEVYGHGLVNAQAALSPVNPTLSNGRTQTSIQTSMLVVPPAMGSKAIRAALSNVTILDAFGRDYRGSVAGRVVASDPDLRVRGLVRQVAQMRTDSVSVAGFSATSGYRLASGWTPPNQPRGSLDNASFAGSYGRFGFSAGIRSSTANVATGAMGLAPTSDVFLAYAPQSSASMGASLAMQGGRLEMTSIQGGDRQSSANGLGLGWRGLNSGVRLVEIVERGSLFGSPAQGALALGRGANTLALEADRSFATSFGWAFGVHGSVGMTRLLKSSVSLVRGSSALLATRFGLSAEGPAGPGQLTLGLDQPLTVERGQATLRVGSGYDLGTTSLTYADRRVSLAGQRRLQMSGGYAVATGFGALRLAGLHDMALGEASALVSLASSW